MKPEDEIIVEAEKWVNDFMTTPVNAPPIPPEADMHMRKILTAAFLCGATAGVKLMKRDIITMLTLIGSQNVAEA
jgi:hypothetical protein